MRAIWDGAVLAESDDTVVVEGNHYFPRSAVDPQYVRDSTTARSRSLAQRLAQRPRWR